MSTATMTKPRPKACRVFGQQDQLSLCQDFNFEGVWEQPQASSRTGSANYGKASSTALKTANSAAAPEPTLVHRDGLLAYTFDGSFEGILSCVYLACKLKENPTDLVSEHNLQLRFGQEERAVSTNMDHAKLVRRSIERNFGKEVFEFIQIAAASDELEAAHKVYQFTRRLLGQCKACTACPKKGNCMRACQMGSNSSVANQLADPLTFEMHKLRCSVLNERERMVQFIRFEHVEGDVWFARCNPNADVIPLLMAWFIARFNTQSFVIFDEVHRISGVYDGRGWYLVKGDATPPARVSNEIDMQNAWRRYFNSLCVDARYNPELQMKQMPKRFWKNITEMQPLAS